MTFVSPLARHADRQVGQLVKLDWTNLIGLVDNYPLLFAQKLEFLFRLRFQTLEH